MATVVTLANQPTSFANVKIAHFVYSQLEKSSVFSSADGKIRRVVYVLKAGDPKFPTTASYQSAIVNATTGRTKHSVLLSTWKVTTVDGVITAQEPFEAKVEWTSADGVSLADLSAILGSAYGLTYDALDGDNKPTTNVLNDIAFATLESLF